MRWCVRRWRMVWWWALLLFHLLLHLLGSRSVKAAARVKRSKSLRLSVCTRVFVSVYVGFGGGAVLLLLLVVVVVMVGGSMRVCARVHSCACVCVCVC